MVWELPLPLHERLFTLGTRLYYLKNRVRGRISSSARQTRPLSPWIPRNRHAYQGASPFVPLLACVDSMCRLLRTRSSGKCKCSARTSKILNLLSRMPMTSLQPSRAIPLLLASTRGRRESWHPSRQATYINSKSWSRSVSLVPKSRDSLIHITG